MKTESSLLFTEQPNKELTLRYSPESGTYQLYVYPYLKQNFKITDVELSLISHSKTMYTLQLSSVTWCTVLTSQLKLLHIISKFEINLQLPLMYRPTYSSPALQFSSITYT
jgi:hypothetical protein